MTLVVNAAVSIIFWVHDGGVRQARHFGHLSISLPASAFVVSAAVCFVLARYLTAPIRKLVDERQALARDLSHELRSPLARMQIALGLARRPQSDVPRQLDRIEHEAQRLDRLIEQILRLSRLEDPAAPRAVEPLDLGILLDSLVHGALLEAQHQQKNIITQLAAQAWVEGDREMLSSAIDNVLRNAVHFTRLGTSVYVSMQASFEEAQILVRDAGPGVPHADLKRIFTPFYRVPRASASGDGGHGIGLAITSRVMRLHGGTVVARNNASGGLDVELRMPVATASAIARGA